MTTHMNHPAVIHPDRNWANRIFFALMLKQPSRRWKGSTEPTTMEYCPGHRAHPPRRGGAALNAGPVPPLALGENLQGAASQLKIDIPQVRKVGHQSDPRNLVPPRLVPYSSNLNSFGGYLD